MKVRLACRSDRVLRGDWFEKRHHLPQLDADLLDQLVALGVADLAEGGPALFVLRDPVLRVRAVLDLCEHALHLLAGRVGHNARTAGVVAVLGGVAHRVPHVIEPTLINEIHDQFELVQTLEVRDSGWYPASTSVSNP